MCTPLFAGKAEVEEVIASVQEQVKGCWQKTRTRHVVEITDISTASDINKMLDLSCFFFSPHIIFESS